VAPFAGAATFKTFGMDELMPRMPHLMREGIFNDISALLGVALAIAFLASLENTLMSKALASRSGDHSDVNQDMFSVGMANIASAIAGGMPASGSLTRSLLNFESGARTRFASLFSGLYSLGFAVLIASSVGWGVPLVDFIPKAALAALVIALSFSLFNPRGIRICLNSTGDDAMVLIPTFVSTLLAPLHVAIFIGVAVSISLFLRKASKPYLVEYEFTDEGELLEMGEKRKRPIPAISIVHVEGDLFFGAAELFRTQIQRTVSDPAIQVIILRLKNARHLDATSVMALEDLIRFMRAKGLHLIVSGAPKEVYRVLKKSGVLLTLQEGCDRRAGESNLFLTNPRNPNLSTRGALKRAQQLLGTEKADIRIFYDPNQQAKST
jgi:SulP family sulfate permease